MEKKAYKYIIVAADYHGESPTHLDLVEKVNEQMHFGYVPLGAPFFGEEMMYQAMVLPGNSK